MLVILWKYGKFRHQKITCASSGKRIEIFTSFMSYQRMFYKAMKELFPEGN